MAKKKPSVEITEDEWRSLLGETGLMKHDSGKTVSELAVVWDVSESTTKRLLQQLEEQGRVKKGTGRRIDTAGRSYSVSVYEIEK